MEYISHTQITGFHWLIRNILIFSLFLNPIVTKYGYSQQRIESNIQKLNQIILQAESQASAQEKVYIHFDKPSYFTGDSIWFKAYVTDANSLLPDTISNLLYVELINDEYSVITKKIIRINNGSGCEVFGLADTIHTGNYFVRAYTNWMRNYPSAYFFVKNIKIYNRPDNANHVGPKYFWDISKNVTAYGKVDSIDLKFRLSDLEGKPIPYRDFALTTSVRWKIKRKEAKTDAMGYYYYSYAVKKATRTTSTGVNVVTLDKQKIAKSINIPLKEPLLSIHFFPEGGQLLARKNNLLAFKISNEYGYGVDSLCSIMKDSVVLCKIKPLHNGIGSFKFFPESGGKYYAIINNEKKTFPLPTAKSEGFLMHIETLRNDSININLIRICNSDTAITKNGYLLIQSQGKVGYASIINFTHDSINVSIPKNKLKDGISAITLFNTYGEPYCERLIFTQPKNNIHVKISTNKNIYNPFEKVAMDIEVLENDSIPVTTNLSLAVTDEMLIKDTSGYQQNIANYLLFSSELKGYIENPEYYFSDSNKTIATALDNVLLTHGWRGYARKYQAIDSIPKKRFKAEKNIIIDGTLNNMLTKKGQKNCELTFLLPSKPAYFSILKTDDTGNFSIPCDFTGTYKAVFQTKKRGHIRDMQILLNKQYSPSIFEDDLYKTSDVQDNKTFIKNIDTIRKQKLNQEEDPKLAFSKKVIEIEEVEITSTSGVKHYKDVAETILDVEDLVDQHANISNVAYWDILHLIAYNRNDIKLLNPYKSDEQLKFFNAPCLTLPDIPVYVVNGKEWALDFVKSIDPYSVKNIEIVCKPNLASQYSPSHKGCIWSHVIFIYTYPNNYSRAYHPGIKSFWVQGYDINKEFYNPDYDKNPTEKDFHDLRTTLYWNPFITTNDKGKTHIQFYNSERKTKILTHIEGISDKGVPLTARK